MESNTFFQCRLYNQHIQAEQLKFNLALAKRQIGAIMLHLSFQNPKMAYDGSLEYTLHVDMEGEITICNLETGQKVFDSKGTNTKYALLVYIIGDDGERLFYIDSSKNKLLRYGFPVDPRSGEKTMDMRFSNVQPVYCVIEELLAKFYCQNWHVIPYIESINQRI